MKGDNYRCVGAAAIVCLLSTSAASFHLVSEIPLYACVSVYAVCMYLRIHNAHFIDFAKRFPSELFDTFTGGRMCVFECVSMRCVCDLARSRAQWKKYFLRFYLYLHGICCCFFFISRFVSIRFDLWLDFLGVISHNKRPVLPRVYTIRGVHLYVCACVSVVYFAAISFYHSFDRFKRKRHVFVGGCAVCARLLC